MKKYKFVGLLLLSLVIGSTATHWAYQIADHGHHNLVYPKNIQKTLYTNTQNNFVRKKISNLKKFFLRAFNIEKYPSLSISENQTISITQFGFPLINLTKDKCVGQRIRENGYYQTEDNLRILRTYIKPGDTVINAGAFIGDDTVFLGKLVGENGHVYAFEPNDISYNTLRKNIILNDLEDIVTIYPSGVSNESKDAYQTFSYQNVGGATVRECSMKSAQKGNPIKLLSIDSVVKEKVDFIFMDVEGHEIKAIEGMENTLQRSNYPPMLIEWSPELYNKADIINFIDKMYSRGYKFYKVEKYRTEKINWVESYRLKLQTKEELQEGYKDILLVRDENFKELRNYNS